jgi:hypothetical protein
MRDRCERRLSLVLATRYSSGWQYSDAIPIGVRYWRRRWRQEGGRGSVSEFAPHPFPSLPIPSLHATSTHRWAQKRAPGGGSCGCACRWLRGAGPARQRCRPPPLPPRGMRAARAEASRQRPSWRGQLTAVVEAAVHPVEKRVLQQHPEQQLARQHARAGQRAGAGIDPAPHREDDGPDLQAPPTPPPRRR